MSLPLVSVICICYNHEKFVEESVLSVLEQTYGNIEIIIIDDASTDNSWQVISYLKHQYPQLIVHRNAENSGNCFSFNTGFNFSTGKYLIDLATDDVMLKERVAEQVNFFEQQQDKVGVIHSNVSYINEEGHVIKTHFYDVVRQTPAEGDVFAALLSRYNVCPPSMMIKRQVLEGLGGYDEQLSYEDFDFWVRSSREWKYAYQDDITTLKRELSNSLSVGFLDTERKHLHHSTIKVCEKAAQLVKSAEEKKALSQRVNYEWREALRRKDNALASAYRALANKLDIKMEGKTMWLTLWK